MKTRKAVYISTIVFSALVFNTRGYASPQEKTRFYLKRSSPLSPELIERQVRRAGIEQTEKLMDLLKIEPGMTVLDIGAGSGQYSYKFAERLKGTGKVFATDINAEMIKYLKQQAEVKNLANIFPVLVKPSGLDKFYTNNKFDLIFVAHTYHYLQDRTGYFRKLRGSLSGNGRLVILNRRNFAKFSPGDISDLSGLIKQLSSEKPDSPFFSCLRESTRRLLSEPLNDRTRISLEKAVVAEFNNMINDRYFLSNFVSNGSISEEGVHFTAEERDFVNWAWRYLTAEDKVVDLKGVLDTGNRDVTPKHYSYVSSINTILIVQEFRKYLYGGKPAPYLPGGYGSLRENSGMQEELASAGYVLEDKYDFIPFELILVFKAAGTLHRISSERP
jgi:ubiquinone/menaquinone biosynthesis C-methylase UbiE